MATKKTTTSGTSKATAASKNPATSALSQKVTKSSPKGKVLSTGRVAGAPKPKAASKANAYMLEAMRIGYWDKK